MSASVAFGAWAQDWLTRLPAARDLVVADALGAHGALSEALERKRAGVPFFASVLLRTARGALAFALAPQLLRESADYDQRCVLFDHLAAGTMLIAGRPQHEAGALDPDTAAALRALVEHADGIVVRSFCEYRALRAELALRTLPVHVLVADDPRVPQVVCERRSLALIWAPQWDVDHIGAFTLALQELHLPLYAVCVGGILKGQRGAVVGISGGAGLVREAALVVDTSMTDPATAIAFARSGAALAVASTSGACEYLDNVAVYDPWDRRSIVAAALEALGRGPAMLAVEPPRAMEPPSRLN